MSDMQEVVARQIQQAPAAPLAPTLPGQGAPAPGQLTIPPSTLGDLSKYTLRQLRTMIQELRSQRTELADRRQTIGTTYERATGDNRIGIGERIRTLDANIVRYENDITRVGNEIASRGGGPNSEQTASSGQVPPGYIPEDDAAGMAFGFSFMTLVLTIFVTRRIMRRKYAGLPQAKQQPNLIASNERLERIEQAVDTIAVEIERVSENQRFMTRLMTETQLGDTIKDVRKSTELAKSAAEGTGG